jgi:hypothetical protein
MLSLIHEAEQDPNIGPQFVGIARTIAHKFGVPVEWLLAGMSWETSHYKAYNPNKVWDRNQKKWIDPGDYHGDIPVDEMHWARNTHDGGGGLVGFTPLGRAKALKNPLQQLTDVEEYLRTRIRDFRVPTPFASPEDFYCVIYAPGISGKPDSYSWVYQGKTYSKKTQMDIYRNQKKQVGWAKITDVAADIRSGPGRSYGVVGCVLRDTRVQILDQTLSGDIIDGNAKWDRIARGFISDSQVAFE